MVHVDERGRDGTVGGRADAGRISHVLERAAAVLMQQRERHPAAAEADPACRRCRSRRQPLRSPKMPRPRATTERGPFASENRP